MKILNRLSWVLSEPLIKMGTGHQVKNEPKVFTFNFQGKDVKVYVFEKDGKQEIFFDTNDVAKCLNMSSEAVIAQCPNATTMETVMKRM